MNTNALEKQVGGSHYKTGYQPVQLVIKLELNFFEGNILKYISRAHKKNGKQDLEKAVHYAEMAMELKPKSPFSCGIVYSEETQAELLKYIEANGLPFEILEIILQMGMGFNMPAVIEMIKEYSASFSD